MRVEVEGLREIERNMEALKDSTAKAALRRSLKRSAQPTADLMSSLAPDDPATTGDDLEQSITVSTKLNKRERGRHRRMFRDDRAAVEMFVGTNDAAGSKQEFGTVNHPAQPFARPAWDQDKMALLKRLAVDLGQEIQRTVARLKG